MNNVIEFKSKTSNLLEKKLKRFNELKVKNFNDSFVNNEENEFNQLVEWLKIHRGRLGNCQALACAEE